MPTTFLQNLAQLLTFLPGIEPVTSLALQGIAAALLISYLTSRLYNDEVTFGVFTPGGLTLIAFLVAIDYWSYKGYEATTYVGDVLISNADLMAFFLGLFILGSVIAWDFPDKWATFKKALQV